MEGESALALLHAQITDWSQSLIRCLHSISEVVTKCTSQVNWNQSLSIQVLFHPFKTLKQELVLPKDPAPVSKRKGILYSIPCEECPRTYIRQTGRSLDLCLQGHYWALKKDDVTVSAVAEHVLEAAAGHQVDLSKAACSNWLPSPHPCTLPARIRHIQHHQAPLNKEGPLARTLWNPTGLTTALATCFSPFPLMYSISVFSFLVLSDMMCIIPAVLLPVYIKASRDCPYLYTLACKCHYLLMKAAIGCQNVWSIPIDLASDESMIGLPSHSGLYCKLH